MRTRRKVFHPERDSKQQNPNHMKKYTEEEIKEHLRAEEHYLRTGKGEDIESRSNIDGQWRRFGTHGTVCLSRFKPAPKIVPFDVTDAPVNVVVRTIQGHLVKTRMVVVCASVDGIIVTSPDQPCSLCYKQALRDLEFTRDGVTWQPYGRKEGV